MFRTPQGDSEWFGPNVETYFPIQSFANWMQLITTFPLTGTLDTGGDYTMGLWFVDRRDNVKIIEFTQAKTIKILSVNAQLPGKNYVGVPGAAQFFTAQEPDPTNAFDPREFLFGGIMTRDSFDSQGRYIGLRSRFGGMTEIELSLDGHRLIKPLVVTNVDEPNSKPVRNIETQKIREESIDSYATLKNLVLGLAQIFNFQRQQFTIDTSGRLKADVKFGDPIYVTDKEMIDETTDGLPNTLKMVVNGITRTFSKSKDGTGGV